MGLFDSLFGSKDKLKKIPAMTPEQEDFLRNILGLLGGEGGLGAGFGESTDYLRQLLDPNSEAVAQFTKPYEQQFEQETIPMLAERFAGAGGGMGGGLSSSGFGQSLGAAGSNLQTQLAALKAGLGQQAAGQLMGMYGNLAGLGLGAKPYGYAKTGGGTGLLGGWAGAGFPGLGGLGSIWKSFAS